MKKPLIAIFGSLENGYDMVRIHYAKAITYHGGVPFLVTMYQKKDSLKQLIELSDGFMFAGGIDVNPKAYGEDPINDTIEICLPRDKIEFMALPMILETKKPILSICRGIQSNNVALGGTLYQDIPTQCPSDIAHRQKPMGQIDTHKIYIEKDSKLFDIIGSESVEVNSFHHQSLKDVAKAFTVTAKSPDGIIEAVEDRNHPYFIGVQWHPEFTYDTSNTSVKLFKSFIDACKKQ